MTIYDERYRAVDSLPLQAVDSDDDDESLAWDEETLVTIDNQPWTDAFDTDTFHKAEYVVTKPAEQPYFVDGKEYTFTKPRSDLKKAQWRLDNLPWTLEHPPEDRVVHVDEARGFWRGPYYDEDADEQHVHLYIPANDDEALEYAAEHEGVSVGFTHGLARVDEYDGVVGGDVDVENVDAFQTDLYYDHVATVKSPRLPDSGRVAGDALPSDVTGDDERLVAADSTGAGIATVDALHGLGGQIVDERARVDLDTQVTDGSEVVVSEAMASEPFVINVHERGDEIQYFTPSLSSPLGTSTRFGAGQLVEDRTIQLSDHLADDTETYVTLTYDRRGSSHVLGPKGWVRDSATVIVDESVTDAKTTSTKAGDDAPQGIYVDDDGTWYAIAPSETDGDQPKYPLTSCTGDDSVESAWNLRGHGEYTIEQSTLEARIRRAADAMDCDLELGTDTESDSTTIHMTDDITIDDMTVDAIAEQHDEVANLVEERDSLDSRVDELEEQRDAVKEERDELKQELDSLREKEHERAVDERVERLTALTDKWEEDELREMDVDSHEDHIRILDERISIFEDWTEETTPEADNEGGDGGDDDEYVTGEVLDLSDTA